MEAAHGAIALPLLDGGPCRADIADIMDAVTFSCAARRLLPGAVAALLYMFVAGVCAAAPSTDTCIATETFPRPPEARFDQTANDPPPPPPPPAPANPTPSLGDKLQALQRAMDWADLCLYRAEDRKLSAAAAQVRAVFMGDSITEYWAVANPGLFTNGLVNRGIAGQTTPQMLIRFRQDVIDLHPRAVHILGGTNDIQGLGGPVTLGSIENNIRSMVELAEEHGIAVVLGAVPPMGKPLNTPQHQAAIKALNNWLRIYAHDELVEFADYNAVLKDKNNSLDPQLSIDALHPNRKGFAVMQPIAQAALRRAIGD
jgi:lysophospholipase L1-like esterase